MTTATVLSGFTTVPDAVELKQLLRGADQALGIAAALDWEGGREFAHRSFVDSAPDDLREGALVLTRVFQNLTTVEHGGDEVEISGQVYRLRHHSADFSHAGRHIRVSIESADKFGIRATGEGSGDDGEYSVVAFVTLRLVFAWLS